MKTSEFGTYCDLRSQGIELPRWRLCRVPGGCELPLANGVHDLNARNRTARRPKRLEAEHRACDPFHRPMVLFHNVIEILAVADGDSRLLGPIVMFDRCRVRTALIDRDLLGQLLGTNRLAQEGLGGGLVAGGSEQKINGVAFFVHGAIEVSPFPFDFHVGFIDPPAPPHRALSAAELLLKLRRVLDDPAVERGVIHCDTPLAHHLLELPVRYRVGHVPPHAPQNNFSLELTALKVDHTATSTSLTVEEHTGKPLS